MQEKNKYFEALIFKINIIKYKRNLSQANLANKIQFIFVIFYSLHEKINQTEYQNLVNSYPKMNDSTSGYFSR